MEQTTEKVGGFTPEPKQANLYHVADNLIRIEVSQVVDPLDQVKGFLQIFCFQKAVCQILQVRKNMAEYVLDKISLTSHINYWFHLNFVNAESLVSIREYSLSFPLDELDKGF